MDLLKEKTLKKLAIGSFYNSVYWVVLDLADFLYKKLVINRCCICIISIVYFQMYSMPELNQDSGFYFNKKVCIYFLKIKIAIEWEIIDTRKS